MVLGAHMKRVFYVAGGALLFAALSFALGSLVTNLYSDRLARSDSDINWSVGIFLLAWPLFIGLGGYLGNKLATKTSPASPPPDPPPTARSR